VVGLCPLIVIVIRGRSNLSPSRIILQELPRCRLILIIGIELLNVVMPMRTPLVNKLAEDVRNL
jgi:hypothetical protein